jgi:hypothetical protein
VGSARLRLTDLQEAGLSYLGRQQFNLNVMDVVVSAGDYALIIEQPDGSPFNSESFGDYESLWDMFIANYQRSSEKENLCGLFSLGGRLTPIID